MPKFLESLYSLLFVQLDDRWHGNWPLTKFYQVLSMTVVYLLFSARVGPRLMANRKPFDLKWPMIAFNFVMVAVNVYFHYYALQWLDFGWELAVFVHPDLRKPSDVTKSHLQLFYFYYLTRYAEWLDTVFFVLRKRNSQLTFLHLYHHSIVPLLGWYGYRTKNLHIPGVSLFVYFNTLLHGATYCYYNLVILTPESKKLLWSIKALSMLQMGQFVVFAIYVGVGIPRFVGYQMDAIYVAGLTQPPFFLFLFYRYYRSHCQKEVHKKAL